MKKTILLFIFFNIIFTTKCFAETFSNLYGSISSSKVNVRVGPGTQYPISWVYKQKHWPVEAIAKHRGWYKIRDLDGEEGWIYNRFFSKRRYAVVFNKENQLVNMYQKPDGEKIILKFEHGAIVKLKSCQLDICHVAHHNTDGWIQRKFLIGTKNIPTKD